ncbi:alkaline shock response membrane anchor protein AmaP [Arthrobacter sp. HLT1-21]
MRETAGGLNRFWLAVVGLVLLVLGAVGVLLASGLAASLARSLGLGIQPAPADQTALPTGFQDLFANQIAAIVVAIVALAAGLLALGWLLAQVPRRNQARAFRLHTNDGIDGYTKCEPRVVAEAVENGTRNLPGVTSASVLLRGTSTAPELNIDVKVDDRADVQDIVRRIHRDIATDLEIALEAPLRKLAVLVNVTAHKGRDKAAVL